MIIKKYHINNLDIHHIYTNKFKTIISGIVFRTNLNREYLVEKMLLSFMLIKTTKKYPLEQDFIGYLRKQYDMKLYTQISKRGKVLETSFLTTIINPKYLNNQEDLYNKSIEVLNEAIFNPYLIDNNFSKELLEKEKRLLIDEIKASYNNNLKVAYNALINTMFKDEFYKIYASITIEEVEKVTVESLTNAYNSLIQENVYVYTAGDILEEQIINAFSNFKDLKSYEENFEYLDYENKVIDKVEEVVLEKDNNQSVLMIGYRNNIRLYEKQYPAMVILNGMLGGYYHSTLIKEVREKLSLAYSISSEYNSQKGFSLIMVGINYENAGKVMETIDNVINDYVNNMIPIDIFNMTKETLLNDLYISRDSLIGMVNFLQLTIRFPNRNFDIEERIKEIEEVTINDIKVVAANLKKDTVLLLKGVKNCYEEVL